MPDKIMPAKPSTTGLPIESTAPDRRAAANPRAWASRSLHWTLVVLPAAVLLSCIIDGVRGAAERGDAEAQYNLAVLYEQGRGYPQDLLQAAEWYRKAADQGFMQAQYNLGSLYADGEGVGQDLAQAAEWYRKAADQGLKEAQHDLAVLLDLGDGVERDKAEATRLFQLAAEQAPQAG